VPFVAVPGAAVVVVWSQAFRLAGGFNKLLALLGCATDTSTHQAGTAAASQTGGSQQQQQQPDADQQQQQQQVRRLQRKVLALLQYVLAKHPTDAAAAAEYGVVPKLQQMLSDQDTDMRAASLAVLDQVVSTSQGWQWVQQHEQGLLPHLQKMQQHAAAASSAAAATEGDGDVGEEEQQLLHKLVQKLEASSRPQGCLKGLNDHIDLDPYQVRWRDWPCLVLLAGWPLPTPECTCFVYFTKHSQQSQPLGTSPMRLVGFWPFFRRMCLLSAMYVA